MPLVPDPTTAFPGQTADPSPLSSVAPRGGTNAPGPGVLTYAHCRNRHPCHDASYWRQLRALLAGGKKLLADKDVMDSLFPRHADEEPQVYELRRKLAFHIPYPGEIVGNLVGQLAQDPPQASPQGKADKWYADTFLRSVDGKGMTLLAYAQAMAREALTVGMAWALVDLPNPAEAESDEPVESEQDQAERGLLDAYVCPLPAESVVDWEEDDEGELLWACVWRETRRRESPFDRRDRVVEQFTFYTEREWARFEVSYEAGKPPQDGDTVPCVASGPHSFGEVPLLRLGLPDGLWAADKMFGTARAHFNQRSGFSYAQNKGLFPILTAFLGPEMGSGGEIPSDAQQNPRRAAGQKFGIGRVATFGKDDRLAYTAPPAEVYKVAADDLDTLRDEMHRVTATMAASMDGTSAAVGRSGESKAQDKGSTVQVLQALGTILCDHMRDMLELVASGRNESDLEWDVTGFKTFDAMAVNDMVVMAQVLEGLDIPSPTFWRVFKRGLARRVSAHDATDAELDDMRKELERNITDEQYDGSKPPPVLLPGMPGAPPLPGTKAPALPAGAPGAATVPAKPPAAPVEAPGAKAGGKPAAQA